MPDGTKKRLLVVEDERLIGLYLMELLTELKYDVCAQTSSGLSALKIAERDRPDLAIVDIGLVGNMDGISTALHLRERFNIPTIFLSGTSDAVLLERAQAAQCLGFIQKPFMPDDIERAVKAAFARDPNGGC